MLSPACVICISTAVRMRAHCRCSGNVIVAACLYCLLACIFFKCVLILVTEGTCQSRFMTGVATNHTINHPWLDPLLSFFTDNHKITLWLIPVIPVSIYNYSIQLLWSMDKYVLFLMCLWVRFSQDLINFLTDGIALIWSPCSFYVGAGFQIKSLLFEKWFNDHQYKQCFCLLSFNVGWSLY